MRHLHKTLNLEEGDELRVGLTAAANVYLIDEPNYALYLDDREFEYYGGTARQSPYRIQAPGSGTWHLVVEQVDGRESLSVAIQLISAPQEPGRGGRP
jgi:hypothetical protein